MIYSMFSLKLDFTSLSYALFVLALCCWMPGLYYIDRCWPGIIYGSVAWGQRKDLEAHGKTAVHPRRKQASHGLCLVGVMIPELHEGVCLAMLRHRMKFLSLCREDSCPFSLLPWEWLKLLSRRISVCQEQLGVGWGVVPAKASLIKTEANTKTRQLRS